MTDLLAGIDGVVCFMDDIGTDGEGGGGGGYGCASR